MGFVVRLFFIAILCSIVLSLVLGWIAMLRARTHFLKNFGIHPRPDEPKGNVIEGEYKVLEGEEDKDSNSR